MTPHTDHEYFEWLISQIRVPSNRTYIYLFERMHSLEFIWTVPNDDNRIQDGLDLRVEFLNGRRRRINLQGVSILEVLIALSRRVEFQTDYPAPNWAWKLIKNLRLTKMSDPVNELEASRIDDTLYELVWRTYEPNGEGGFFPLKNPAQDQTKVEIWYQMNAYIMETPRP